MLGFSPLASAPLADGPITPSSPTAFGSGAIRITGAAFAVADQTLARFTQTVLEVWVQANIYNFAPAHVGFTPGKFQVVQFGAGHITFTSGNFTVSQGISITAGHIGFTGAPFALGSSARPFVFVNV